MLRQSILEKQREGIPFRNGMQAGRRKMSADMNGTESGKTKTRHGITKAGAVIIITACLLLAAVISVCGYLVLEFSRGSFRKKNCLLR
jgi:hypothetical protein